jgi:hypothetical protein
MGVSKRASCHLNTLVEHKDVEIACQTIAQRAGGAFTKSIEALLLLNELGYGGEDTGLTL